MYWIWIHMLGIHWKRIRKKCNHWKWIHSVHTWFSPNNSFTSEGIWCSVYFCVKITRGCIHSLLKKSGFFQSLYIKVTDKIAAFKVNKLSPVNRWKLLGFQNELYALYVIRECLCQTNVISEITRYPGHPNWQKFVKCIHSTKPLLACLLHIPCTLSGRKK